MDKTAHRPENSIDPGNLFRRIIEFIARPALLLLFTLGLQAGGRAQSLSWPISPLAPPLAQADASQEKTGYKFTVTYGFVHNLRSRNQDIKSTVMRGPISFGISVAPWLTIKLGNDTFKSKQPLDGDRVTGPGDTSLTLISRVINEQI